MQVCMGGIQGDGKDRGEVCAGIRCGIGPYTPKGQAKQTPALQSADATLQALSAMGVPVIVQEKE